MLPQPNYLNNCSPTILCDQVMWLVKNSGLNFSFHETPFSLDIKIKKKFVTRRGETGAYIYSQPTEPSSPQHLKVNLEDFLLAENKLRVALLKVQELEKELAVHKSEHKAAKDKTKKIINDKNIINTFIPQLKWLVERFRIVSSQHKP